MVGRNVGVDTAMHQQARRADALQLERLDLPEALEGQAREADARRVHVIAKRSSHYVMLSQPNVVIDKTRRVVRAGRRARR
jgi:hypothetical protein